MIKKYSRQRKKIAFKLKNPRLLQIHFHAFRHWKATMEYRKNKDILHVKQVLRHKSHDNTMLYALLINFKNEEFTGLNIFAITAPTKPQGNASSYSKIDRRLGIRKLMLKWTGGFEPQQSGDVTAILSFSLLMSRIERRTKRPNHNQREISTSITEKYGKERNEPKA